MLDKMIKKQIFTARMRPLSYAVLGSLISYDVAAAALEEVVVTARKQKESLMDVPVAVAVIGGGAIERQNLNDLNTIAQMTPQVILGQGDSGAGASFSIRGLGSSAFDGGIEQSVVVSIDGVPATRGNIVFTGMFDLEQVEVLKGPQALFFGKNSPAGVIALTSRGATDELEAHIKTGYEFEADETYVEAAISGPITETLKGRLAARWSDMDGWMKNVAQPVTSSYNPLLSPGNQSTEDRPGREDQMFRVTLTWEPTENFSGTFKYTRAENESDGSITQAYCEGGASASPASGFFGELPDPFNDCKFDNKLASTGLDPEIVALWPKAQHNNGNNYIDQEVNFASLTLDYEWNDITFTSVTGYMTLDHNILHNFDNTSYGLLNATPGEYTDGLTQEFRFVTNFDGPLNVTGGIYYEQVDLQTFTESFMIYAGADPVTGKFHTFEVDHDVEARTNSAFLQLRYDITEALRVTAGARWTDEEREQTTQNLYTHAFVGPLFGLVPAGIESSGKFSDNDIEPEVTISYDISDDLMVYAAYKTGYKSGGFSAPSLFQINPATGNPTTMEELSFDPETAEGFELGLKGYLLDRSLRFEAVAYRYEYDDLQTSVFSPETFSFTIRNASSVITKGVELSTEWQATDQLRLFANAAYNKSEYDEFTNGQCYTNQPNCDNSTTFNDLSGEPITRAPKLNYNLGLLYDIAIGDSHTLQFSADMTYTDEFFTQEDHNPFAVQDDFTRVNAGLRFFSNDDRYVVALIGRNLENTRYVELSTSKAFGKTTGYGDLQASTPRGREVALEFTYRFW